MHAGREVHVVRSREDYLRGWRQRLHDERREAGRLVRERRAVVDRLARLLVDRYGVRQVYLFGSLARETPLHQSSDIDLAVSGLSPDQYFRALAELWDLLPSGVELDLVPLEFATPAMSRIVRKEGELLCDVG